MDIDHKAEAKGYAVPDVIESPCEDACPVHLKCHSYIALTHQGEFEKAFRAIRQRLPLPGVLGYICDKPCEKECPRNLVDMPLSIRDLKRFVVDYAGEHGFRYRPRIKTNREEKVAIIGSGPAGLSAAYDLAREGFPVTVFEALSVAGGMMAVGCPEFKLPKQILKREIENITSLGVEIKLNHKITDVDSLFQHGYKAIFIATGTHEGSKLPLPGADAKDVLVAASFLREINLGKSVSVGKRVLIVGGGDVACDCARAALRLGATEVRIVCPEAREKMPAHAWEIAAAECEGAVIHPSLAIQEIVSSNGKVTGVKCLEVSSVECKPDGTLRIHTSNTPVRILPAGTVIFAIGQKPDRNFLAGIPGAKVTAQGLIFTNPETLNTGMPGVFAGGDAVSNAGSVVKAIASGQKAALAITAFLNGQKQQSRLKREDDELTPLPEKPLPEAVVTAQRCRIPASSIHPRKVKHSFNEVIPVYSEAEAKDEASRCQRCDTVERTLYNLNMAQETRSLEEQAAFISQEGMGLTASKMRLALIGGLELRSKPVPEKAEDLIFTGCYVWGTPYPLVALCRLLRHFGKTYGLLRHEECCGAPLWLQATAKGTAGDKEKAERMSQSFVETNLANAKAMGGKNIYYMCIWCTYIMEKVLQGKSEIKHHYYIDLLLRLVDEFKPSLKLNETVGYFAGGRHRKVMYISGPKDHDWLAYRALLNRIEGLKVVDLPPYCCVLYPDTTINTMREKGLTTLVTPCITCYGRLMRRAPPDIRVITTAELLLEALGQKGPDRS